MFDRGKKDKEVQFPHKEKNLVKKVFVIVPYIASSEDICSFIVNIISAKNYNQTEYMMLNRQMKILNQHLTT